ncbi:hypothetical protein BDV19DRAFT_372318 [Aspergillus venezuelensis]
MFTSLTVIDAHTRERDKSPRLKLLSESHESLLEQIARRRNDRESRFGCVLSGVPSRD